MLYTFRRMFLHRFLSSDYTVCILELQLHLKSLRFHRFNKNISISFPRYPLTKKKKYHLENIIPRLQKLPQSCLKITQTYHPFTHHRATLRAVSRNKSWWSLYPPAKLVFPAATRCIEHFSVGKLVPVSLLLDFPSFFPISWEETLRHVTLTRTQAHIHEQKKWNEKVGTSWEVDQFLSFFRTPHRLLRNVGVSFFLVELEQGAFFCVFSNLMTLDSEDKRFNEGCTYWKNDISK